MLKKKIFQAHPFHLVDNSPWPLAISWTLFFMAIGAVLSMQGFLIGSNLLLLGLFTTVSVMFFWFGDINTEGSFLGNHTKEVKKGLILGFFLFVISEVMAFLSVFWAYFHSALSPSVELGGNWAPLGITALDPFAVPLINTFLLLSSGVSHKCESFEFDIFMSSVLPFSCSRVNALRRIGPHNSDILSILIGSLLGDGHMEKSANGARFAFYQAKVNGEYLLYLHEYISNLGYCKKNIPILQSRKGSLINNFETRYIYRFRTYTYSSFNWIYDAFYPKNTRKVIPLIIEEYLTPLALAVWMMDDGTVYKNKGFKFSTNSFTLKEIEYLRLVLIKKYNIKSTIHKSGLNNQYNIYIPKDSFIELKKIVKPFFHPTMVYKLNLN